MEIRYVAWKASHDTAECWHFRPNLQHATSVPETPAYNPNHNAMPKATNTNWTFGQKFLIPGIPLCVTTWHVQWVSCVLVPELSISQCLRYIQDNSHLVLRRFSSSSSCMHYNIKQESSQHTILSLPSFRALLPSFNHRLQQPLRHAYGFRHTFPTHALLLDLHGVSHTEVI